MMAYMLDGLCCRCHEKFTYNAYDYKASSVCGTCLSKEKQEKEDNYFAELDELTLEERIRLIEKWIYYYKPRLSPFDERF